jgi:hypothetical protein
MDLKGTNERQPMDTQLREIEQALERASRTAVHPDVQRAIEATARIDRAQAALRAELQKQAEAGEAKPGDDLYRRSRTFGEARPEDETPKKRRRTFEPLPLAERYRLFRDAVKATVGELAPSAVVVTDRVEDETSVLVELSLQGVTVDSVTVGALGCSPGTPELRGTDAALLLCRSLQAKLGQLAIRGGAK